MPEEKNIIRIAKDQGTPTQEIIDIKCECGCGQNVKLGSRFIYQHHLRGKIYTEEEKHKISEATKGIPKSEEHRHNISMALKGKPKSETHRQKLKIPKSEDHKHKIGDAHRGVPRKPFSEMHRLNMSMASLGIPKSDEHKRNMSLSLKGRIITEEHRLKISIANKGKSRPKISVARKQEWADHLFKEKRLKQIVVGLHIKPNKPEIELGNLLNSVCPGEYKYTGDGAMIIAGMIPDYTNINGKKRVIELFGDYWHRNDNTQNRIDKYEEYGYDCLIIWEHELKDRENVTKKILGFVRL